MKLIPTTLVLAIAGFMAAGNFPCPAKETESRAIMMLGHREPAQVGWSDLKNRMRTYGDALPSSPVERPKYEYYHRQLIRIIGANWSLKKPAGKLSVLITLDKKGKLGQAQILTSSGNKELDEDALKVVRACEFPPVPQTFEGAWFKAYIEASEIERALHKSKVLGE